MLDPALESAYRDHDRQLRLRYSRAACLLIGVLVPAGVSLDYFMYPGRIREFLLARLTVAVVAFGVFALHQSGTATRHVRQLALVPPLLTNVAICWMIYRTEGSTSPYYAGLNLVLFGIAVLLPWSFLEALLVSALTLALYLLAGFANPHSVVTSLFFNNAYFLLLASVICCTSAFMKSRARKHEFELQAQVARSNAQLTHMERLKTQFFANISHELRTPLTLILSPLEDSIRRAQQLRPRSPEGEASASADGHRGEAPGASPELLEIAYQNALRLLKLINDLLEFVRLDAGARAARKEPIAMGPFVQAQLEALRPLASLQGLELSVELAAEPLWVSCDPSHLERILVNLLTNAIKYTPAGGRVSVRLAARGDTVVVDVSDTGIGIGQEDLAVIFNRFRQAENARRMSARGMGIGLALAKELCEENDGKIVAKSRLGAGTSMAFELPRVPAPSASASASARREPRNDPISKFSLQADRGHPHDLGPPLPDTAAPTAQDRPLVLVVDDEPDMRRYVAWTLSAAYRVEAASDGRSGLDASLGSRPAVVVLDQMMPDMEGIELCARLRQEPEEIRPRVIMITARTDDATRLEALSRGADDFLEKPFSGPELELRVANLVRARSLEQRLREQNQELQGALERITAAELELVANEKFAALGRMAGGLLHELNNPLNNALTAVSVARERGASQDEGTREIIKDVDAGLRRVRDVIGAVRAFSHPSNGAQFRPVHFNRLVEVAHAQTRRDLKELQLAVEIPADTWVSGVEAQLIQVLTNLLANAAEAIQRSGVGDRVEIRVDLLNDRANVQVLDNGPGIPEALRRRVLEPFVTSKPPGSGMGLGLAICDRLVRNHGSGITVQPRPEGGTRISFDLRRSEPIQV